jgi:hypothetical protein
LRPFGEDANPFYTSLIKQGKELLIIAKRLGARSDSEVTLFFGEKREGREENQQPGNRDALHKYYFNRNRFLETIIIYAFHPWGKALLSGSLDSESRLVSENEGRR